MTVFLVAEHFVRAPDWKWFILLYFFLAGLGGGTFALGSMLTFWGREADRPAARLAFLLSFPLLVLCPVLLIVDLGRPPASGTWSWTPPRASSTSSRCPRCPSGSGDCRSSRASRS